MAMTPKPLCRNESIYGYDPNDVISVGGPKGKPGPPGKKGDKGDKGDQGIQGIQGEVGPAGADGDQHYRHVQGAPSTIWTVTHNLNKYASITVVDSAGNVVEGSVLFLGLNEITLEFSAAFAGEAYCN